MSITLSKEHGVNPSLLICSLCGQSTGIALLGELKEDKKAPREMLDQSPCDDCKKKFDEGNVFIIEHESENGSRTGRGIFIPREALAIEVEGYYVGMLKEDFEQVFEKK